MSHSINIPRVFKPSDYKKFFDRVKEALDTLLGKKTVYDRALTVRDLEKLGWDMDLFLAGTKQSPYEP